MVCTANDLSAWKDFPKGLRVLLLDQDSDSATEMKLKLESMDYIGEIFLIYPLIFMVSLFVFLIPSYFETIGWIGFFWSAFIKSAFCF